MAETVNDSFLEDIIANPEDNAPRLIYADWLEDHGDPDRAEFIRGQIAMEGPLPTAARDTLVARGNELLEHHGTKWANSIHGLVKDYTFRRGFVAEVAVSSDQFLDHATKLAPLAPIQAIHLEASAEDLERLLQVSLFTRVTRLEIRGHGLGDQGVERLARSPNLGTLEWLILHHCGLTPVSAQYLIQMPLQSLKRLNLGANDLQDEGLAILCTSSDLTALEYLGLGGNELGNGTAFILSSTESLQSLEKLNLGANYLNDRDVELLANASHLGGLRDLDLRYNEFGHEGAIALVNSPYLANLMRLDLTENAIGPEAAEGLRARFGSVVVL